MARSRWLEPTLLLLIIALAAALRLWRVAETPGWFTDEGTHLEIARHLANGRIQYLSPSCCLTGVPHIMAEVVHWPLVFESGSTQIYENPDR